jgi:outer membrane protein, heavy metal efflux system
MKTICKYITIILLLLVAKADAQTELMQYLKTGAENNPGLEANFYEYNAALEKIPQVGALPDPRVSFGYFVSPLETRVGPQRTKIGISQMFPWFGTLNSREDVAVQLALAKFEVFEEAKSRLFFDIKSTYFNVYFINRGMVITEENIRILNTFQQLAIIKIETGESSVVDELRVEMEINELKDQLAFLADSKFALEVKFNKLLNVPVNSPVVVPDTLWIDSLELSKDEFLDSITIKNHVIKQLEHKMLSWKNQEIVSRKMGMPQFSVGIDYAIIGESSNPNIGSESGRDALLLPKVGISIPLYRKKYTALVKEASLNMQATVLKKEDRKNHLTSLFEKGYKDYRDADRRIDLYKLQLILAEKSLNILLTSYSADGEYFEEILRMERKVLKYSLEVDKARADKSAVVAFINYLLGK